MLLGATGCAVGPDYAKPSLWSPASWFRAASPAAERAAERNPATAMTAAPVDAAWWDNFNDPVLGRLVRRVAAQNLDVRTATIRLAESRAQRRIVAADEFPQVNGNASYTRERISPRGVTSVFSGAGASASSPATQANGLGGRQGGIPAGVAGGGAIPPFNLFQYGFDTNWELDLWGRVRRLIEQANAQSQASAEVRNQAVLSAIAEVARDYIQLRGAQRSEQVLRENLASARESAAITAERVRGGVATDLDMANAEAMVAGVAGQIPQMLEQKGQLINALSFLLGETPGALTADLATPAPIPPAPARVPIGLPSQLAERRPDIRQAEAQLHAATAAIGAAQADFFPRITLSGSLAIQALQLKGLGNWDSRTYGIGPAVTLPIFQGGRIRATVDLRNAEQQEAAVAFQWAVLQAFQEVDDALIAYHSEQSRRGALAAAVDANHRAVALATQRYRSGVSDFLEVLTAQRSLFAAQQQLVSSQAQASVNLVQLYKALGGGWAPAGEVGRMPAA
jgi:NodT family efflux transporter outer membrane factor (OMF) lipoprotein